VIHVAVERILIRGGGIRHDLVNCRTTLFRSSMPFVRGKFAPDEPLFSTPIKKY